MAEKPVAVIVNHSSVSKRLSKSGTLRWTLVGIIFATLIAVTAIFIGYRRLPADSEGTADVLKQTQTDIAINEIRHTATRNGKDEWTLTAKSAKVMGGRNQTVIDSLSVIFYLSDGKKVYLTARKGILKTETNDLEVVGDVTMRNDEYVLRTERLRYDHRKRLIYSKVPVVIKGNRISLSAEGMYYDLNTRTSTFKGNVESTVYENIFL